MQSATEVLAAGHLTTHDMESGAKGPQSQPPRLKDSSSLEKSLIKRRQEVRSIISEADISVHSPCMHAGLVC